MRSKKIERFALTVGALFAGSAALCGVVLADEIVLDWTIPEDTEQCTNAGPYLNPDGTRIWELVGDVEDPEQDRFTLTGYKPGVYSFVATSYDTEGIGSRISGQSSKVVTSFKALAGSTAYQPVTVSNASWLLPVGTVSVDTECILTEEVNGKYAIPNTAVDWDDGVIAKLLVVADCV